MYKDKKTIAIIPARSGSKGLPDKNIKELNGKPLIAHSIECAVNSGCFDCVFLSTDSQKYAEIGKQFGAHVPFLRSEELANDVVNAWAACEEALGRLEEEYDVVVLLQPTSPLRTPKNIVEALDLFHEKNADFVVSVTQAAHPIEWCSQLPESLSLGGFIKEEHKNKRRQDLPQSYTLNGAIYVAKAEAIKPDLDLYSENSFAYVMEQANSVDIDGEVDFLIAKTIAERFS